MQTRPLIGLNALDALVAERDLILVTGKGGTGKSTLVAALAELAARRRGGAVAVEISAHPRLAEMIRPQSGVRALNLEVEQVVGPALSRLLSLPAVVGAVLNNRILRLFVRTSPAMREMILLDEIQDLVARTTRQRQPVIVDLPASGHALSFLDTPRSVYRMLRVGPLAQVARRVEELLLDRKRTELVVVAIPEELPVNETIELVQRSMDIGLVSRTIVVNQVPALALDADDRPLLDALHQHDDSALGRFASTAARELDGVELARAQISRLKRAVGDAIIELPLSQITDPRARVGAILQALSA